MSPGHKVFMILKVQEPFLDRNRERVQEGIGLQAYWKVLDGACHRILHRAWLSHWRTQTARRSA